MGNQCSFSENNSLESSRNPLPTPPGFQFSEVKIEVEEHRIEHPIAPETQFIHSDCQSRCIFKCQICPKTFSTLQALAGHQNAHKKDKLPQKRPSKAVREQVGKNDNAKGKKKLCCTTGHHQYSSSASHPDYEGSSSKTRKNHVGNGMNYNQDRQNCSNQHIIYAPKLPLRAVRLNDRQVVTRPVNQGNYQPSYSLILNSNNQSISYDVPSFGRSPHATPPPPPPAPAPGYWPPNSDPAFNIHGIPSQVSGLGHQGVHFPRPVMFPAQKLYQTQSNPAFPPGFGEQPLYGPTSAHTTNNFLVNLNYLKNAADVNNNDNVGAEQPNAWNLDLTLRL